MLDHGAMTGAQSASAAVGVVLAGGAGSRLDGAKAAAKLGGRPLVSYPVNAFRAAGLRVVVVAKPDSRLGGIDCEVLLEPAVPTHPLVGLLAAIEAFAPAPIVVCACDMPFVPATILVHLARLREPLVVAAPGGRLQPLLGRYEPSLEPGLARSLDGLEPLTAAVSALGARLIGDEELARFGDPSMIAVNVNTAAELATAERTLGGEPEDPAVS